MDPDVMSSAEDSDAPRAATEPLHAGVHVLETAANPTVANSKAATKRNRKHKYREHRSRDSR